MEQVERRETGAASPIEARVTQPFTRLAPLENGDHLTCHEFERRYAAMPKVNKAELIEGVVRMPCPVHNQSHAEPHSDIVGWLYAYRAETPGVRVSDNATLRLDADNEVQPDVMLRIDTAMGGKSRQSNDDYLEGAPELIVEIASSSASYDLHEKMQVYRRNGVQEYLVWRVLNSSVDWWELNEGAYLPLPADSSGVIQSRVFPGLCLDVPAMLSGDAAKVLSTLQAALSTQAHTDFIARLRPAASS
jgi:Uma2 family endonuclease